MQNLRPGRTLCLISILLVSGCGSIRAPKIPIKDMEFCEPSPRDGVFCSKMLSKTIRTIPESDKVDFLTTANPPRVSVSMEDIAWVETFIESVCNENPKLCDRTFLKKTREMFDRHRRARRQHRGLPPTMEARNE